MAMKFLVVILWIVTAQAAEPHPNREALSKFDMTGTADISAKPRTMYGEKSPGYHYKLNFHIVADIDEGKFHVVYGLVLDEPTKFPVYVPAIGQTVLAEMTEAKVAIDVDFEAGFASLKYNGATAFPGTPLTKPIALKGCTSVNHITFPPEMRNQVKASLANAVDSYSQFVSSWQCNTADKTWTQNPDNTLSCTPTSIMGSQAPPDFKASFTVRKDGLPVGMDVPSGEGDPTSVSARLNYKAFDYSFGQPECSIITDETAQSLRSHMEIMMVEHALGQVRNSTMGAMPMPVPSEFFEIFKQPSQTPTACQTQTSEYYGYASLGATVFASLATGALGTYATMQLHKRRINAPVSILG